MTYTPLTKAERDHLTLLHTAARDPMSTARERSTAQAQLADQLVWTGRTDPMNGDLPRLLADLDAAEAERDAERKMRVEAEAAAKRAEEERDALKAKLADPRRVLIHETEVVATKEEIATLKARLADLSEADEELHTCRALVNATSENLRVDLERMVDDLAEANEKAARSEKDSHSWHELYKDTKAKLAALVEAATSAETILGNMAKETGRVFGRWEINHEPLRNDAQRMLPSFRAAIAAARGGAL